MRISRFVAAVAGTGLLLLGPSAQAAPSASSAYPPGAPQLTVSATSITAGGSVTVTCTGLLPGSDATVTWSGNGALGAVGRVPGMAATGFRFGAKAVVADGSGVATTSVRLISVGDHTITVAGTAADGTPVSLSATVAVTAAAAGAPLPHTGAPLLMYTAVGLLLLLLGALVVAAVRKRRHDAAAAVEPAAAPQVEQPVAH